MAPRLITIPSADLAFQHFVQRTLDKSTAGSPAEFEHRLRRMYPRALVRERGLAGEQASWYVYRDGAWRDTGREDWWDEPAVPVVHVSGDGWIEEANATARGLLGIEAGEPRHFTDFVVPGGLDDAVTLFDIVRATGSLDATVLLQPASGDAIAVDIHVAGRGERMVAAFRLAADIAAVPGAPPIPPPALVEYLPRTDVAFRSYGERALGRMPEPTADGLALRLRRLYPHAQVEGNGSGWVARRDRLANGHSDGGWWLDAQLPRVRYDALGLILEANEPAVAFFGRSLAGHHWQEFVTAGSTDEVATMLDILAEVGAAESRFRMPSGDGTMLEFDSYTVVDGADLSTVFRLVPGS